MAPAAERTGDFSAMLPLGCPTGYKAGNSALCANGTANPFQLYNPYTGVAGSGGSVSRSPIPTNNLTGAGLAAGKTIGDISVSNRQTTPGKTALNTGVFNTISSQQFSYHLRTLPQMISTVRQDGLNNLDSSLLKDVHFTEPVLLQLRFETFNTLNHPTFAAPAVSSATSSAFGVISSTYNTSRQTQLGGRIVF